MTKTVRITKVGDGLGIELPADSVERLQLAESRTLHLRDTPNGIALTYDDPTGYDAQMAAAERVMREDRDALRRLAR